jgi:hypothetical protein
VHHSSSGSGSAAVGSAVMNTVSGKGATTEGEYEKKPKEVLVSSTMYSYCFYDCTVIVVKSTAWWFVLHFYIEL